MSGKSLWRGTLRWGCAVWMATTLARGEAQDDASAEGQFLSNVRQLSFEGRRSGEGYFSPDGKRLIFQSERERDNPFYQIYVLDLESGDTTRVSPGLGKTTCGFFRPGTDEVIFASTHLDPASKEKQRAEFELRATGKERRYAWDYDEQMDIFLAKQDGTNLRRLTSSLGYDAECAFSPDGQKIVFSSVRNAYPLGTLSPEDQKRAATDPSYFAEIYIMNADGSDQKRLTHSPGYDGGPFFSPNGQRIVWRRFDRSGVNADVYTMNTDGTDVRQLTQFGCMSWAPFFHPTGKYLIFTANKLGFANFELFLTDAEGVHEPVRVTFTQGFDGLPSFSPEGHRLCWTSNRTGDATSQLFLANWNEAHAQSMLDGAPPRMKITIENADASAPAAVDPNRPAITRETLKVAAEITTADLREEVTYLASDALQGRMSGSEGAQLAARYIAEIYRRAGLKPAGDDGSYFEGFEFNSGVRVLTNQNRLSLEWLDQHQPAAQFEPEKDFRPLAWTVNGQAEGPVVFAGYGLSLPGKAGERYDSYSGLDVTNKIVLLLRYVPENVEPKRRQELNRYAGLRYKAMLARERGARAVLVVTGPNSPNPGQLAPLTSDTSLAGSGIIGMSISIQVANALLTAAGRNLASLQTELDTESPHAEGGFLIPNVQLKVATAVEQLRKADRNVIGRLAPSAEGTDQKYLLVGAHYDHLGFGETGAMMRAGEEHSIHPGADDNASGVATVLELAAALSQAQKEKPRDFPRGILFACWSGEELGLVGSTYFSDHSPVPLSNIVAYINFDMVGRLHDNKLILQGISSSPAWRRLIEKRNVAAGFNLSLQDDPYLPTDVTALYPKGIPVLNFFTGSHEDYHRPTDQADKLNYEGLRRIALFARGLVGDLAKSTTDLEYGKVTSNDSSPGGQRENLRAYLGTIPDYATEVKTGVKLSGVRGGSPAARAGLKGGDIIVEFAGQQIKNIYDYTYALDAAKIGQAVAVVVLRDGERTSVQVIPEARK